MKAEKMKQLLLNNNVKTTKYFRRAGTLIFVTAIMLLTACGVKEPFLISLSDADIEPGVTTVQELSDAGYDFAYFLGNINLYSEEGSSNTFNSVYDLASEVEGNTINIGIVLVKNGEKVANVTIVNRSSKMKPLSECIICDVTVSADCAATENVVLAGIDFKDLSVDKLSEVFGKPDTAYETGDYFKWKRGDYSIDIRLNDDGSLKEIGTSHNEY